MKFASCMVVFGTVTLAMAVAALAVRSRFQDDLTLAAERAAQGSVVVSTRCGPIEVQEAGVGIPLLMIHGSGGGHDQGMAWARPLVQQGVREISGNTIQLVKDSRR